MAIDAFFFFFFCRLALLSGAEQGLVGEETSPLGLQGDENTSMTFDFLNS